MFRRSKKGLLSITAAAVFLSAAVFLLLPKILFNYRISNREKICYEFLVSRMTCEKGAVKFKILLVKKSPKETNSVLTESIGIFMHYILAIDDRAQFEKQYSVLKEVFLAPTGLLHWQVHIPSKKKDDSNASLDDLRVAHALILGYEKWGEKKYLDFALSLSENMKKKNVKDGFFVESCSWNDKGEVTISDTVDISYLDLTAMDALARYDGGWRTIRKKSEYLLTGSAIPGGLFWDKYDVKTEKYFFKDKNMINNVMCAVHLARAGLSDYGVCGFLRDQWKVSRKILGAYDPETREPAAEFENIAVYALAMQLAILKNDRRFVKELYEKISKWQIGEESSYYYGAFAIGEIHSFDNLEALLAFSQLRRSEREEP